MGFTLTYGPDRLIHGVGINLDARGRRDTICGTKNVPYLNDYQPETYDWKLSKAVDPRMVPENECCSECFEFMRQGLEQTKTPQVGDEIYVPRRVEAYRTGGRATVAAVTLDHFEKHGFTSCIEVEGDRGCSINWSGYLAELQPQLKAEFGDQISETRTPDYGFGY